MIPGQHQGLPVCVSLGKPNEEEFPLKLISPRESLESSDRRNIGSGDGYIGNDTGKE